MYRSGFNSALVEERPGSFPSHSSGTVSSLPRGHHTCRLLQKQLTQTGPGLAALGDLKDNSTGKQCGKEGSEVDGEEEERRSKEMKAQDGAKEMLGFGCGM